jgi:hypothetical protein
VIGIIIAVVGGVALVKKFGAKAPILVPVPATAKQRKEK